MRRETARAILAEFTKSDSVRKHTRAAALDQIAPEIGLRRAHPGRESAPVPGEGG